MSGKFGASASVIKTDYGQTVQHDEKDILVKKTVETLDYFNYFAGKYRHRIENYQLLESPGKKKPMFN